MKILFLCHRFPLPADGGGKIRALHIAKHLVAAGHAVTLGSLVRSEDEAKGAKEMATLCARVIAVRIEPKAQALRSAMNFLTARPSSFGYFYSPELQRKIDEVVKEESYDLILVHCSSMGPYVMEFVGSRKIIDFADMDSQKWLDYARQKSIFTSLLYLLEGKKLERWERTLARTFDACTTISPNELEALNTICGGAVQADWFTNGVDLDYFQPVADGSYDSDLIAFVGRMDYFPNAEAMRWFCREVWPGLRERRPSVRLRIVGANPPRSVRNLARLQGIEVTGFVPDVRPHLEPAAAAIAPLRIARGMQNKVLECMAMGIPVVASPMVVAGLGVDDAFPVQAADTPRTYLEAILSILESPSFRSTLSTASRKLVETRFSWSSALEKLDSLISLSSACASSSAPDESRSAVGFYPTA